MPLTLKQLEERLAAVEQELAALRKQVKKRAAPAKSPRMKKRPKTLLELADESHDEMVVASREDGKELGSTGKPISAEKLQQLMIEEGIDPTSNWLTGEMIELRNQTRP